MEQSKYTFHFTEKELREFSFRAVADVYCKRPSLWLILLILCAVDFLIVPVFSIVLLIFLLSAVAFDVVRTCRFLKKEHLLERRIMWVEDGMLKCRKRDTGNGSGTANSVFRGAAGYVSFFLFYGTGKMDMDIQGGHRGD